MNLDELINSITETTLRENIYERVSDWKLDNTDINYLYELVTKWHGNVWFKNKNEQHQFYLNVQLFKKQAIDNIGSMTLNERLYWFGLFNEWDNADNSRQSQIRSKLHASA